MKEKILRYIKSFNWKFIAISIGICIVLAITNNLIVSSDKHVEWFGSQPVMAKPGEEVIHNANESIQQNWMNPQSETQTQEGF